MSRTNEKRTTLHEYEDCSISVDYFWASEEDGLILWNTEVNLPTGWIHSKVRVDLFEFTENFESLEKAMDFKTLQLYINDAFIGELVDIREEPTDKGLILRCSVVVGAG